MLGQGLPVFEAASAAVVLHAKAGDLAATALSRRGMISSDIIEYLPRVFQELEINGG
jgi:NAD(P)H-hydrate epimerase